MAFTFTWEERGFVHRHSGVVTPQDLQDIIQIFYNDPRHEDCKYLIADYAEATDHTFSYLEMSVVAGYDIGASKSLPQLRQALVATSPKLRQALEYYVSLTARSHITWEARIFNDSARARAWALEAARKT